MTENSIHCTICGAVFKHIASLKYHLSRSVCTRPKRDEESKILKCHVCDKTFKGLTAMNYHIRRKVCEQVKVQTGPPYICNLCSTSFNLKQSWYVHMKREACKKYPEKYGLKKLEDNFKEEAKSPDNCNSVSTSSDGVVLEPLIEIKEENNK